MCAVIPHACVCVCVCVCVCAFTSVCFHYELQIKGVSLARAQSTFRDDMDSHVVHIYLFTAIYHTTKNLTASPLYVPSHIINYRSMVCRRRAA